MGTYDRWIPVGLLVLGAAAFGPMGASVARSSGSGEPTQTGHGAWVRYDLPHGGYRMLGVWLAAGVTLDAQPERPGIAGGYEGEAFATTKRCSVEPGEPVACTLTTLRGQVTDVPTAPFTGSENRFAQDPALRDATFIGTLGSPGKWCSFEVSFASLQAAPSYRSERPYYVTSPVPAVHSAYTSAQAELSSSCWPDLSGGDAEIWRNLMLPRTFNLI